HRARQSQCGNRHPSASSKARFVGVRPCGRLGTLSRFRSAGLDPGAPVRAADRSILGELFFAGREYCLKEGTTWALDSNQKVSTIEAFIKHTALIFTEVVVVPLSKYFEALQQAPNHQGRL